MNDRVVVSDSERRLSQLGYTVNTVQELKKEHDGNGALLMGDDQLAVLHKWYQEKDIPEDVVSILVVQTG